MTRELYIGLMSGTSADAIDSVLVDFSEGKINLINSFSKKIPTELKKQILDYKDLTSVNIQNLSSLEHDLSELFAVCVNKILVNSEIKPKEIIAIGSHGQTIWHAPQIDKPYTIQLGDPNIISSRTGIRTVSDFRRMDIANNGEGAPLAPLFHKRFFGRNKKNIAVVNIGGISNISFLDGENDQDLGFDIGPGNCLMDLWIRENTNKDYDDNGELAKSGKVNQDLINIFLKDNFFNRSPPKSTGTDYFNIDWLNRKLSLLEKKESIKNIQASLLALTSITISNAFKELKKIDEIFLCGGGVNNNYLVEDLKKMLPEKISSTEKVGLNPDFLEAICFAWLAKKRIEKKYHDLTGITGNRNKILLGNICEPPR
tara:strand:+ start:2810 stop:3922 length:1113 start_codon:yes stop_codon:yes gene_type:complete